MHPIRLRGARTHNLQGIDLDLRAGELVSVTGPSGAGKSSLALDTLYAEGQRRFVESFSPYARKFLERLERPPIDELDPIAATVAVDRRAPIKSSRSTLATMADLEPYLAALFAREAIPRCAKCGVDAVATAPAEAAAEAIARREGARATVSYALRVRDPEEFLELREALAKDGYRRLIVGGVARDLDEVRPSEATAQGTRVEVVVDRLELRARDTRRLQQAIETAWDRGGGRAELRDADFHAPLVRGLSCPKCGRAFDPPRPALFSYNSPLGACEACRGFGRVIEVDWDKVIPDPSLPLGKNAIKAWSGKSASWERRVLAKFCGRKGIPMDVPWEKLSEAQRSAVIEGEGGWRGGKFPGVRAWFKWLETRTYKMHVRVFLSRFREYTPCTTCHGARLNETALTYRIAGKSLSEWHALTVEAALAGVREFASRDPQGRIVLAELRARLEYLDAVGLGYVTLDRQARTLSGGEAQRAGLTTALGARITGALFVLDEPSIGLHPTDVPRLSKAMRELSRAGNAVLVIEHDRMIVEASDRVVELGPGAGRDGGRVLFDGWPADLARREDLPTARAWRAKPVQRDAVEPTGSIQLRGVRANNLKDIDVEIPLGVVCAITGPSGSGKSTLAEEVLYRAVARALGDTGVDRPGPFDSLSGMRALRAAVLVDQSPLGRTARGNAATYTKAWDRVRARFAAEPAAVRAGLGPSHFSFNVAGAGRCEACAGEGFETVEMQFLADVQLVCPVCHGKRFNPDVLAVQHRGKNIADLLAMTVDEAIAFLDRAGDRDFVARRTLQPVVDVGLGYLPLGQPLSTLSGGEAQRLKLARALSQDARGTLFVLDEPSAGLHALDTAKVISALHLLSENGASVVVVEHDTSVIRACDWVIDLGPDAGPAGGRVVATGTPGEVARTPSRTGLALAHAMAPPKKTRGGEAAAEVFPLAPAAISVEHAREHNLKDVSCNIPHGALAVVTGPSGSGKSSLAFDVVFAEGQRRFMETLTPYARQFLPTLPRPDVDRVTGVPPSIALEQRTTRGGANSTVATVTEIAHYLRLLYAKVGVMHCPECDAPVRPSSPDELFARLTGERGGKRTVYAPAVRARKGTYLDLFTEASRAGVRTARVDGAIVAIDPPPKLKKTLEHTIDLIVHYGELAQLDRAIFDRALGWGHGALRVASGPPKAKPHDELLASTARTCSECGTGLPELDPRWFSFNTKQGQCEACEGTGVEGGPSAVEEGEKHRRSSPNSRSARACGTQRCEACAGTRLAAVPRRVQLFGETYPALLARDVSSARARVATFRFTGKEAEIARAPLAELVRRLEFTERVGLGYLSLDRMAATLSGGEMQRLRLSAQLGSGLTGALYVLDEPTIGLHPRDTGLLLDNLRALVDTGSTVLVVEHDAETIRAADHLIELGPGGGRHGGHIVAQGPASSVLAGDSVTARSLREPSRTREVPRPPARRFIELGGAREHNLKDVAFRVPVGRMTVVAGVSGSGKSTLVRKVFYPALREKLGLVIDAPAGAHDGIKGTNAVKRALAVDQSPIGRSPRSVPATFLGVWDDVRKLFASLPEAKLRGYGPARFSFNTAAGGRCTACEGQGSIVAEMAFLPDVISPCETCGGARFEPATLDVKYRVGGDAAGEALSIGDVLHLTAEDATHVFAVHPKIRRPLSTLVDLGVGYLQLGQAASTLSGGEAQRLKLAAELTAGAAHEPTVYVLDEPTTGLHLADVRRLIGVLDQLVERGDTLVVIEHHPDVIASADWVVELGPEGGAKGGRIVFEGEPGRLSSAKTATGRFFAAA
ncbi:MAG TPA: excinuclease ABC subunit UvrA [Polyangiaceae bacterium]|nr:excinuclease ABC subunit UvrA [Polyangiaceae bacterium]